MNKHVLIFLWLLLATVSRAHVLPVDELHKNGIKIIENKGQWENEVLFKAHIPGGNLFITNTGLVYSLYDEKALHDFSHNNSVPTVVKGHSYKVHFQGAQTPTVQKFDASTEYYNYFKGSDRSKWASMCRAYGRIVLKELYPGIDLEIIALDERIKLNFNLKPLADIRNIQLRYDGVDRIQLINNELMVSTEIGAVKESKPVSFQSSLQSKPIETKYVFQNNVLTYECTSYNNLFPLVIDPEIVFGTFSGSVADNFGFTATFDNAGNGYAGGTVYETGFPTTLGAFQRVFGGGTTDADGTERDCGILKFSTNGQQLIYCTYLGGNHNEQPHSMICNSNGELIIMGTTKSNNFPVGAGAYDGTFNGSYDVFVTRLNANGTAIMGSTYLGGTNDDGINGDIAPNAYNLLTGPLRYNFGDQYRGEVNIDQFGNIVIASSTRSNGAQFFPIVNGFQITFGGQQDGFVAKFNATLSNLLFSTYLGGTGHDAAYGIAFDNLNNYYITGGTSSGIVASTAPSLSYNGGVDAYVARISPNGNQLQKLIYLGTNTYDQSYFVQIDAQNRVYITGQTESNNFPTKLTTSTYRVPGGKQFISIFNRDLDSLILSTTWGKGGTKPSLSPSAFLVDNCGRIYVSGWGGETNQIAQSGFGNTTGLPVSFDAFQAATDGSDFYLTVFARDMTGLSYATFIGDINSMDHVDGGTSRFDPSGVVYQSVCAGCGGSSGFPTTPGAWSRINKGLRPGGGNIGGCNNALVKVNLLVQANAPEMKDTVLRITAGDSLQYIASITDVNNDNIESIWSGNLLSVSPNLPHVLLQKQRGLNRLFLGWKSTCANIGDSLLLRIISTDDGCPTPMIDTSFIRVVVLPPAIPAEPFPECLTITNDSIASVKWDVSATAGIEGFKIYRSVNGTAASLYLNITDRTVRSFNDTGALNNLDTNYCYYLASYNKCGLESTLSRTICTMYKEDTATVPGFYTTFDTLLFVTATKQLEYETTVFDSDLNDSVFVNGITGSLLQTGRMSTITSSNHKGKASLSFKWLSECQDIVRTDTLYIQLQFIDNQCPTPRTGTARIKVVVLPPPAGEAPVLKCVRKMDNGQVEIRWDATTTNEYFSHFVLIRKSPDGTTRVLDSIFNNNAYSTVYFAPDNDILNYCYAAYPVTVCRNMGDTSAFACTVRSADDAPLPLRIYTVTVENNEQLGIYWQQSSDTIFDKYRLYKREVTEGPNYKLIATYDDIATVNAADEQVDVSKLVYCYQLRQVNECGLESPQNQEVCSIVLKGESQPFVNKLNWTEHTYWPEGVSNYIIEKSEPALPVVTAGSTTATFNFWSDESLNNDNGLYYYTVIAVNRNKSFPFEAKSNTIELIQKPILYVPNVFTPNDDQVNDDWRPRPIFVKDYNLKIYTRWGQLVFESDAKYDYFKGEVLANPGINDAYIYVITYTGWDGSVHTDKGNFTILR